MNNSKKFIKFLIEMNKNLPTDRLNELAKNCIIDFIACAYAGSKLIGDKIDVFLDMDASQGKSPIIGMNTTTSPAISAFVNAMNAHSTELDDGHRFAMLHIEAPIISALISAVSAGMVTDAEMFMRGIIIGYEVTCRLAQVMQPNHKLKGFHATGTCATCGAALAIGFAAGFDETELNNTLSSSVACASGLLEMIDSPSQLKPFTVGNAAKNGYTCACIAKAGFIGPEDPLCGKRGFYNAFATEVKINKLFDIEATYKIEQRYLKPYASCRHCHPSIEGVLKLKQDNNIMVGDIQQINIETYSLAIFGHDNKNIVSVSSAKMSTPYSVATALVNDGASFASYSNDCINNDLIKELSKKVSISESNEFNTAFPKKRGALVTIILKNNKEFSQRVDYPLGEPENPMNREDIISKYYELGSFSNKNKRLLDSVLELTLNIENNFNNWMRIIVE